MSDTTGNSMTWLALALVLTAALIHASWNFLLKKSGGGPGLITAACLGSVVVYAPFVAGAAWVQHYGFRPVHLALMFTSGMIHTAYFLLLDRAYRSGGDLSIVYPLARATGPLLTIVVAVAVLGERPGPTALAGAVLIVISALVLTGNPLTWHKSEARHAVGFALLTGFTISMYTICDKASVAAWLVPPLVYDWGCNFFRSLVLVPVTQKRWPGSIDKAWRERRKTVIAIAVLSPLSYILVLTAMVFTPVSLVAPAREVSILFAALMGAYFLKEGDLTRRLVAAAGMALGVAGLTVG
ncbi:MAG TPA: EamA family transporter [Usitatibacteraceae bacterium]|nr:EamA family transporter [Usitatibacteraceae bacterium]